jgi:uncharacterized protein YndB with AHSA1/START domain
MAANIIKLQRIIRAVPEKIYRAFIDPDAICKWMPPYGFTCKVHQIDVRVGGKYKMSFTNFTTGKSQSFGGKYIELIPNESIVNTDEFDDPSLPGTMQTRVSLKEVACGTELNITQDGIPDVIPVEFCYLGWQESIDLLIKLVEPNIPD